MKLIQRANKGRGLELTVIASQGALLTLDKMATQVVFRRGGATQVVKSPPDFIGTVNATPGRAALPICFDAKECEKPNGFPIRQWARERPLQREWILRHGAAGAVAGLLVESKEHRLFLWLDWREIRRRDDVATIPWNEIELWVVLGNTLFAIQFDRIPGVVGA